MSEEARLARLGLLHLKGKPEEYRKRWEELQREAEEHRKRADAWDEERKRRRTQQNGTGDQTPPK